MSGKRTGLCLALLVLFGATVAAAQVQLQVIQGQELEGYLLNAEIAAARGISIGITGPQKLTLTLNGLSQYGTFKAIDEYKALMRFDDGRVDVDFQDSWKSEIAAYEIDKLIGLGMVPTTVERTYKGQKGSVQFWVDSMMSLGDREKKQLKSPDAERWNQMMYKARLFDNLIYNTDRNLQNLLITKDWEVILIDHSRAFRPQGRLKSPKDLTRFSRSLLQGIERLNRQNLTETAGKYLPKIQIDGILQRRDLILETARKAEAQLGRAVYYP